MEAALQTFLEWTNENGWRQSIVTSTETRSFFYNYNMFSLSSTKFSHKYTRYTLFYYYTLFLSLFYTEIFFSYNNWCNNIYTSSHAALRVKESDALKYNYVSHGPVLRDMYVQFDLGSEVLLFIVKVKCLQYL